MSRLFAGLVNGNTYFLTFPATDTTIDLHARSAGSTYVILLWTGTSLSSVTIQRKSTGSWQTLAILGANENAYIDRGCYPSTGYSYRVKLDSGEWSLPATVTTPGPETGGVADPSNLQLTPTSPTTVTGTFDRTNTAGSTCYVVQRRGPNTIGYETVLGLGTDNTFTDVGLTPNSTYFYRVGAISTAVNPSNYTTEVSVTTPARTAGYPSEPSSIFSKEISGTSVVVTWTDNTGGLASHEVYYGLWNGGNPIYALFETTAPGITTSTVTGLTPERPYVFRVRAVNGTGASDYGLPSLEENRYLFGLATGTCTSSPGVGTPQTYELGTGQAFETWNDLPELGPGDVVNVHPRTYVEAVLFPWRGTPDNPITIRGTGTFATSVLDGSSAIATDLYVARPAVYGIGLFVIGAKSGATFGYAPGNIIIDNLRFTRAYDNTGSGKVVINGTPQDWAPDSAGVYAVSVNNVTISNCQIDDNANGVFMASTSSQGRIVTDVILDSNYVFGNSSTNGSVLFSHNTYIEAIRATYTGNRYGPTRTGGFGVGLKDRSTHTVVRYNFIEGGATQLQLPEAQNSMALAQSLPSYRRSDVVGNTLYTPPFNPNSPIWYGGDQGLPSIQRNGICYFAFNTCVSKNDKGSEPLVFKTNCLRVGATSNVIDARNCILTNIPVTAGFDPPDFGMTSSSVSGGIAFLYTQDSWVPVNYFQTTSGDYTFTGVLQNDTTLLHGSGFDPGFLDPDTNLYAALIGSEPDGAAGAYPARLVPINKQFDTGAFRGTLTRATLTTLGAYPAVPDTIPPRVNSVSIGADGLTVTVTCSEAVVGHTGFTLHPSGGAAGLTYSSGEGTTALVYVATRTIRTTETATIDYTPGDVTDIALNPMQAFSGQSVSNQSTSVLYPGPNIEATTTHVVSTTVPSLVLNRPPNTTDGDLLLGVINVAGFIGSEPIPVTPPSGFTLTAQQSDGDGGGTTYFYTKTAGASEPSTYTWSFEVDAVAACALVRIDGQSGIGTPVTTVGTNSTSQVSPAVTCPVDNCTVIRALGTFRGGFDFDVTIPVGRYLVARLDSNVVPGSYLIVTAETVPSAGNSGTATFTTLVAVQSSLLTLPVVP